MTLNELAEYLEMECYNPMAYHIGPGWERCGDTYCLDRSQEQFEVFFEIFYVERGKRGAFIESFQSEDEACRWFISFLDQQPYSRQHCIGFFSDQATADSLVEQLRTAGVSAERSKIPSMQKVDRFYRVFVFGRDLLRAEEVLHGSVGKCRFGIGDQVVYRPTARRIGLDLVTNDPLKVGSEYTVKRVRHDLYVVVEGYQRPGAEVFWSEFAAAKVSPDNGIILDHIQDYSNP